MASACGDGNKVSDAGNEAPGDGGHHAVIVEILLAVFHLLLIEQTEFSPFAVGETIDEGATQIVACKIVDGGTAVGPDGGKQNHQPNVEVSTSGMIGSGRNNEFRRDGDDGAL